MYPELTPMTRLEVVVRGEDVPALTELLRACGARGYTVLSAVEGFGHHGLHQGRLHFNDRDTQRLVLCVVPDDRAEAIVSSLRHWFQDRPGVLFVSPTMVFRPEYFQ